jgi:hypothetical protein
MRKDDVYAHNLSLIFIALWWCAAIEAENGRGALFLTFLSRCFSSHNLDLIAYQIAFNFS